LKLHCQNRTQWIVEWPKMDFTLPISIASEKAEHFRNRKNTLSINVMIACDFDLKITLVSSGWEGSATDCRVLRSAMSKGFEVPPGKFYLVDGGYAKPPLLF